MAVPKDVSLPHISFIAVIQHKNHTTRAKHSVAPKMQRSITICAVLFIVLYILIWSALRETSVVPKLVTRVMPTQPPGVWTFEKLAPDSAWQYNATALEDVRKITARLKIKKRLQEKKLGGVIGTALPIGHYKTCAVVGNSGVLLGSRCGAEIDSMDYVIRIDLPVLRGFEKDVGRRTNMTVLNLKTPRRMAKSSQLKNRSRDVYKSRLEDVKDGVLLADPHARSQVTKAVGVYKLSISLLILKGGIKHKMDPIASDAAKKRIAAPTTGLVSVLMMTTFCDRSYMYGFFPFMEDANNQSIPYHYYPDDKLHIPFGVGFEAKHDVNTEYEFLRDLHRRGVLKMHLGPCGNQ